jgi:1-acyl-sn-glycerol-3-phosphate acyltransferase
MWIGSPLRGAFRLLSYFTLTLVLLPPYLLALAMRIQPVVRWMPVIYHRTVCFLLGIRVQVRGTRSDVTPTLFVCNHVSYLDIEVMGGLVPGSFVAKAGGRDLAVLLDARQGAAHRSSSSASRARPAPAGDEMMRRLNTGDNPDAVPRGHQQRRHARAAVPQRPVRRGSAAARRQADRGPAGGDRLHPLDGIPLGRYWRPLFAWFGDLDLVPHLWQMVCLGETEAVVTFFPPIDIDQLGDRKKLAEFCFRQVSLGVQAANSGRYELLPRLA